MGLGRGAQGAVPGPNFDLGYRMAQRSPTCGGVGWRWCDAARLSSLRALGFSLGLRVEDQDGRQRGEVQEVRHSKVGGLATGRSMFLEGSSVEGSPRRHSPDSQALASALESLCGGLFGPCHLPAGRSLRGLPSGCRLPPPPRRRARGADITPAPALTGRGDSCRSSSNTRLEPSQPSIFMTNKRDCKPCMCTKCTL